MYVALVGNLTDGYTVYGSYETFGDAAEAHDSEECWIMEATEPRWPWGTRALDTLDEEE